MRSYSKIVFCSLLLFGLIGFNLPAAFSQEAEVLAKEASGKIVSVNLEESTLVVKQLKDEVNQVYENVTFYVNDSTLIEKDYETVSLADLSEGEEVAVEYATSKEGKNIASYIQVIE